MDQTPENNNGLKLMVQAPVFATNVQSETPLDLDEEKQFLLAAKADRTQFAILYDRYYDRVYFYLLRRCADPCLAEDLTADTFFKAMRYLPRYQIREIPFSAWLLRIAHNQLISYFRREKVRRLFRFHFKGNHAPPETAPSAVEQTDPLHATQKLAKIIQILKPVDQLLITLRYFEDFTLNDAAAAAGLKPGTARTRLHRALHQLKTLIENQAPELADWLEGNRS